MSARADFEVWATKRDGVMPLVYVLCPVHAAEARAQLATQAESGILVFRVTNNLLARALIDGEGFRAAPCVGCAQLVGEPPWFVGCGPEFPEQFLFVDAAPDRRLFVVDERAADQLN